MPGVYSKFAFAVAQHRAGNFQEAESIYRAVIAADPGGRDPHHADALHLLGVIASEAGQHQAATALIVRAIQVGGPSAMYCSNLGVALSRQGRPDQAVACFRQALQADSADARTHSRLGQALLSQGRWEEAVESFLASTKLAPAAAQSHFELGNALHALGRYEGAAKSYLRAMECEPAHAEASHNLGVTRTMQQRPQDAISAYERAIQIRPGYAEAHLNLGTLTHALREYDRAIYHYRQALKLAPDSLDVRYNLALLYQEREYLDEALKSYGHVLERKPDHSEARNSLGNTLLALGRPEEAILSYRRSLADNPESVQAHWNMGVAQLLLGRFAEGWQGHEWRFRQHESTPRVFPQPLWDGAPLNGKRILLHAEQGLGDTIQFIRYAQLAQQRGGHVILECQQPLLRLLAGVRGIDQLVARGFPLPGFDCHAPLLSLPRIFRTTLETIPAQGPYIDIGGPDVERWRDVIRSRTGSKRGLKVGLTWAGNPVHKNDHNRSLRSRELSVLEGLENVLFFGLQKGAAETSGLETIDLLDASSDFRDTAAILLNLDLLISVDTSTAHLAGAIGRPVWTLLPFAPDWRWMLDRQDSPWYPSMKLYRQDRRKDWTDPLCRVRADLEKLA